MTPAKQRARADVIFDGRALEGPTRSGRQRFRVARYLKGSGPRVVRVYTGRIRRADGTLILTSISVNADRGQRWRIYARRSASGALRTSVCDGSRRLSRKRR
jgi:phosphohistidine phosphatase SixA